MLIRFIAKNIYSFYDETEFNLLPGRTKRLGHHKIKHKNLEFMRFSALYGANGSGKSNLIRAISHLDDIVEGGELLKSLERRKFKLKTGAKNEPISLGIEFLNKGRVYFYTLTFNKNKILHEYLAESTRDKDKLIFEREYSDNKTTINFYQEYYTDDKRNLFAEVLAEKLIENDKLLITFLGLKYSEDFPLVADAHHWFKYILVTITPDSKPERLPHILDVNKDVFEFTNDFIPNLNTGISSISVEKKKLDKFEEVIGRGGISSLRQNLEELKANPNSISSIVLNESGEVVSIVYENEEFITKRLVTFHRDGQGNEFEFDLGEESDGTRRLIDYIFAFESVINRNNVFLIDEIERSIHPILIKEIISKISLDENVKGQLIFTTHESNLLDQDILRPDEIWFAQKDVDGTTKLYSLSDFKVHNTIDIQNGYLDGRYGGIPFLSNLNDLNWHKHEVSD